MLLKGVDRLDGEHCKVLNIGIISFKKILGFFLVKKLWGFFELKIAFKMFWGSLPIGETRGASGY